MTGIHCRRAEELLSDHLDGTLAAPLAHDLEAHLAACAGCRALREAMAEVVAALRAFPVIEPPADLAERAATLATSARRLPPVRLPLMPSWLQAAAAVAALTMTGLVLTLALPGEASRTTERLRGAGVQMLERADRIVEDVRLLRVMLGTAFDSRLGRVNDRVEDYRRLLERRRASEAEQKKTRGSEVLDPEVRAVNGPRIRQNNRGPVLVTRVDA